MDIANIYRSLRQILDNCNIALVSKGLGQSHSLNEVAFAIDGKINKLPYFFRQDMTKISAGDISGAKTIKNYVFERHEKLRSVEIPDTVTVIGYSAFGYCRNLKTITIPDSVTKIQGDAFYECNNLENITIPKNVTYIGHAAFFRCNSITDILIPESVTFIGSEAFSDCSGLTNITIPISISTIEDYTFYNCTSLTSITIPDSVTLIGYGVFRNCTSLSDIYLNAIVPPSLSSSTTSIPANENLRIHVPIGSGNAYKSATNWSNYADKIVEDIVVENTTE